MLGAFLSGAVMMAFAIVALFFIRFWTRTKDHFFALFALAFILFSLERWVRLWIGPTHEAHSTAYLFRLIALLLIMIAIIQKNRAAS